MKKEISIRDVTTKEGKLTTVGMDDCINLPVDFAPIEWESISDTVQDRSCRLLDDVSVLRIPKPQGPQEEEELVNRFLNGMRKLFSADDNWAFLSILETSMNYCAQCNSCAEACHLFEASGRNEMYRPNLRSEIFRRIYKQYIAKVPFAKWRYGDLGLNWKIVVRLGEMAYRCNLCRRCAQTCPLGVDNGLIAREIRKLFSQELGFNPPELHDNGTVRQLSADATTDTQADAVKNTVEAIGKRYSELTGYEFRTPWDVRGADILLIHSVFEISTWPESIAAFSIIFGKAGISWTLSSDLAEHDATNFGTFYDDVQFARTANLHMRAAKKLGVQKVVLGECGHMSKALMGIADRFLPQEVQIPRESCLPLLRDIVLSGKIRFDPARNNFPVTLHDPCNVVRFMGINRPQREILHALCPQFREMTPHGVNNYCCGGGSGFSLMSRDNIDVWRNNLSGRMKMSQICGAFSDCLPPETKKYVCTPCSSCKVQIGGMLQKGNLFQKNLMQCGGIVELIVNAMSDVNPGFITWDHK